MNGMRPLETLGLVSEMKMACYCWSFVPIIIYEFVTHFLNTNFEVPGDISEPKNGIN